MIKSKEQFQQVLRASGLDLAIIELPENTDPYTVYCRNYQLMHSDLNHKWLARLVWYLGNATGMSLQAAKLALFLEHVTWWDHGYHFHYLHLMLPDQVQAADCDLVDGWHGDDQGKSELDHLFALLQQHDQVRAAYVQLLRLCAGAMGQYGHGVDDGRYSRAMKRCATALTTRNWRVAREMFQYLPWWWD